MSDIFARQLDALRARSLDRHLREISSPQGPIVELAGIRLINFSSNDISGWRMIRSCARQRPKQLRNLVWARARLG